MIRAKIDRLTQSSINYWFSFASDSCAALFMFGYGLFRYDGNLIACAISAAAGFLTFGLVEYLIHRWFFHASWSPAYRGHVQHHDNPRALIALPWFLNTLITMCIWWLLVRVLPAAPASIFTAMLVIGYIYYGLMHHVQHHYTIDRKSFLKSRAYHNIHHKLPETNFGVTTTVWDKIFGTHYRTRPLNHTAAYDSPLGK